VDEFLEERPSKTTSLVVTTADQLDALLSRYAGFYAEGNRTPIYSTDDYGLDHGTVQCPACHLQHGSDVVRAYGILKSPRSMAVRYSGAQSGTKYSMPTWY
jgi:hypothetical protein